MIDYQDIFEHTGTALAIIDRKNIITLVNENFERLSGYSKEEIEGKLSWRSFVTGKDLETILSHQRERVKNPDRVPKSYEIHCTDRHGTRHDVLITVNLIDNEEKIIVSLIDISEKKKRENHITYRLALEEMIGEISREFVNAPDDMLDTTITHTLEKTGRFVNVDRSYLFLISEENQTMRNTHEWCAPGISPQIDILQDLPLSDFRWFLSVLNTGRNISVSSLDQLPPEAEPEKELLQRQDIQSLAVVPINYTGVLQGYFGFDSTRKQVLWKEEDFHILRTIGDIIINGIMQQRLKQKLVQAHKMEALGRLAGSIAHDFNNILTTVKGHSQLLLYSKNLHREDRDIIDTITEAAESGARMTNRLMAVSNDQKIAPIKINLNAAIQDSRKLFERLLTDRIRLVSQLDAKNDTIKADLSQVEQVVMNLVLNSADAMPEGGEIRISTRNIELLKNSLLRQGGIIPGQYVLFQVIDNGHGMDETTLEKALEPFFTTKAPGKGNGLGLSTVYAIVEQYNGYMDIFSSQYQGTRIDIYFPLAS